MPPTGWDRFIDAFILVCIAFLMIAAVSIICLVLAIAIGIL